MNSGGPDSTADRSKKSRLTYVFSHFNLFFLHFSLNLRHKCMPYIHSGKQTKLSKTSGVQIRVYWRND